MNAALGNSRFSDALSPVWHADPTTWKMRPSKRVLSLKSMETKDLSDIHQIGPLQFSGFDRYGKSKFREKKGKAFCVWCSFMLLIRGQRTSLVFDHSGVATYLVSTFGSCREPNAVRLFTEAQVFVGVTEKAI